MQKDSNMMSPKEKLIDAFKKFPGVGPRQAQRFVYYLRTKPDAFINDLHEGIRDLKTQSKKCSKCQRFFDSMTQDIICRTCSNSNRNHEQLMIVQRDIDLEHFESSDLFNGYYFVLGGTVPIGKQDDIPAYVRISGVLNLIKEYTEQGLEEIILALHINPEGEQTADIVANKIQEQYPDLKVTKLGRGLSTGSEIEYADKDTLRSALDNRK